MIAVQINPGLALLAGAFIAVLSPASWRSTVALLASLGALALAFTPSFGEHASFAQIGLKLVALRLDALSQTFGVLFALMSIMLSLHGADPASRAEGSVLLVLAGGAMTAVYSGDFISFVASAELSTLAAVALLLLSDDPRAQDAGMRLLGWQALSSLLFLSGAAFSIVESGGADFARLSPNHAGGALILAAFGVKAGFPVAHIWFKEAVARASDAGAAGIIGFTTMLGVYGIYRGYAGEPALIVIGLVMAVLGALYAMAEDDLRRGLAYGLIAQTGLIVTAIGIGSPLALSGAAAHAFACGLSFMMLAMALGAVRALTGSCRASDLGGLARAMPVVATLTVLAGLSIAGAPLTAGYAAVALVGEAAEKSGLPNLNLAVLACFAAGVIHTALKIPYAVFFAPARRPLPPPGLFGPRHLAMVFGGALIVGIGVAPRWLYAFLPSDPMRFAAYDLGRMAGQLELVLFALLAAAVAGAFNLLPAVRAGVLPDFDQLIYGPLWRLIERAGVAFGEAQTVWRNAEAQAGRLVLARLRAWIWNAERPTRPWASQPVWLLAVAASVLLIFLGYVQART